MRLLTYFLFSFIICTGLNFAQAQVSELSFEKVDSLQKETPKHHVVFIHTDWCQYCNWFKENTLKNKEAEKLLNESFYYSSLNAESKENINFNGYTFTYEPTGRKTVIHQLATALGTINEEVSYPSICILNSKNEIIFQHNQLMNDEELLSVLNAILASD